MQSFSIHSETDFFNQSIWNSFYKKIHELDGFKDILPPQISWKEETLNPESFMYYRCATSYILAPQKYSIDACILLENDLSYYSNQLMHLKVWSFNDSWYKIEIEYEIESFSLKVSYQVPQHLENTLHQIFINI
ncbi:MAG: hypothetical protein MUC49_14140 [Raineya sp.]|jgi:hypothetical protein|nr:hypothetical protein [Raineya sp.]